MCQLGPSANDSELHSRKKRTDIYPGRDQDRPARKRDVLVAQDTEQGEKEAGAGAIACKHNRLRLQGGEFRVLGGLYQEEVGGQDVLEGTGGWELRREAVSRTEGPGAELADVPLDLIPVGIQGTKELSCV